MVRRGNTVSPGHGMVEQTISFTMVRKAGLFRGGETEAREKASKRYRHYLKKELKKKRKGGGKKGEKLVDYSVNTIFKGRERDIPRKEKGRETGNPEKWARRFRGWGPITCRLRS